MIKLPRAFAMLIVLGAAWLAVISGSQAHSLSSPQNKPDGVTVSPAFQQVSVDAGEAQHPVSFTITNDQNTAQSFSFSVQDFNTLGESGGLFFVGTNPTQLQKKYGLAKWFSLSQKQITIPARHSVVLHADVLNLPDLSPGGHYGALMVAVSGPSNNKPGNAVALRPIASSLLFVTKVGGDTHKLGLDSVQADRNVFKLPSSINLRFHNDGNTHLVPRGVVTVTAPDGKVVSKGIINDASQIILPETFRRYYVPLQPVSSTNRPGHYEVKVDFRFDGISQVRSYQQSVLYLPPGLVVLILMITAVLAVLAYRLRHSGGQKT